MTTFPRQLEALSSDAFVHRFAQLGTVEGIYAALRKSREVRALHSSMREEMIDDVVLDQYVRSILRSFVPGEQLPLQLSIASIAVACVGVNKAFARNFVTYLANMHSTEMNLATQIASLALQSIPTTIRETITENAPNIEVRYLDTVPRSDAGQTTFVIGEDLVNA